MMARRTSALRIALAVLAASFLAPLAFSLLSITIALVESLGRPGGLGLADLLSAVAFVWFASVLIAAPLTLGVIAFPLSVFWFLHHRAGGGRLSFLAGGSGAGLLLGLLLISMAAEIPSVDAVLTVLIFTLTATATTAAIWRIAYGGKGRELSIAPAQAVA
jgi:hypothetical protein